MKQSQVIYFGFLLDTVQSYCISTVCFLPGYVEARFSFIKDVSTFKVFRLEFCGGGSFLIHSSRMSLIIGQTLF